MEIQRYTSVHSNAKIIIEADSFGGKTDPQVAGGTQFDEPPESANQIKQ